MSSSSTPDIVTITLNPTVDRVIEVPGLKVGSHVRGRLLSWQPAGKAVNVSRSLALMNVSSVAAGFACPDTVEAFRRTCLASGISPAFTTIEGMTRENITLVDPETGCETHIRDVGPTVDGAAIQRLRDDLKKCITRDTRVVVTGSCAQGMDVSAYRDLLMFCQNLGGRLVIDAADDFLRVACDCHPAVIKPNIAELADTINEPLETESEIIRAGRHLAEKVGIVLVTLGDRGAYCFADGSHWHGVVQLDGFTARSTVGCGDAFLAGFLAGYAHSEKQIDEGFRYALAVSVASAADEKPADFDLKLAESLLEKIELKKG
jgi:1-phosphofructokinase